MQIPKKVWIDTDVAIGMGDPRQGFADVDDAWAMVHLFHAEHIQVMGLSTVFGNTDIENATRLAIEIYTQFGPEGLSVARGASTALDLSQIESNAGVEALIAALEKDSMHIMAIGPATNIATCLLLRPDLVSQIESVVLVAGRRSVDDHFRVSPEHEPPFPDLNFDLDPNAFRILIQSQVPMVLLPFEISHKTWINQADLDQVAKFGEVGKYLAENSQNWLDLWQAFGCSAFNPFDILASAYLVDEKGFEFEELVPEIVLHWDDTQTGAENPKKSVKPYFLLKKGASDSRKIKYCHTPPENFKEDLLKYIAKP
ncbi:MAG: nucleoside hydrolase [Bacteroidota bacterium]